MALAHLRFMFLASFPSHKRYQLLFFSGSSLNSAAEVWSGRPKPDRCDHGVSGRVTIKGRIITDTDPVSTTTEWYFQQPGPEKGWLKAVLFPCPESLIKWKFPIISVSDPIVTKLWSGCQSTGLFLLTEDCSSSWMIFVSTHALHSHLHWSKTILQYLLCTVQGFTSHNQSVLLIDSNEKAPKTFTVRRSLSCESGMSADIQFHPVNGNHMNIRQRKVQIVFTAPFPPNTSPIFAWGKLLLELSDLSMAWDSASTDVAPFVGPRTVVKSLFYSVCFFPGFCTLHMYFPSQTFLEVWFSLCGFCQVSQCWFLIKFKIPELYPLQGMPVTAL